MDKEPEPKKLRIEEEHEELSYPVTLHHADPINAAWYRESLENPETFWDNLATNRIHWIKKYDKVMEVDMTSGSIQWFINGVLNVTGKTLSLMTKYNYITSLSR